MVCNFPPPLTIRWLPIELLLLHLLHFVVCCVILYGFGFLAHLFERGNDSVVSRPLRNQSFAGLQPNLPGTGGQELASMLPWTQVQPGSELQTRELNHPVIRVCCGLHENFKGHGRLDVHENESTSFCERDGLHGAEGARQGC